MCFPRLGGFHRAGCVNVLERHADRNCRHCHSARRHFLLKEHERGGAAFCLFHHPPWLVGVPIAFSLGAAALMTVIGAETLPASYIATVAFTSIDNFPHHGHSIFHRGGHLQWARAAFPKDCSGLLDELVGGLAGGMAFGKHRYLHVFRGHKRFRSGHSRRHRDFDHPGHGGKGLQQTLCGGGCGGRRSDRGDDSPSNPFVVYGVAAQASVGKLFMAGIVPGLLTGFCPYGHSIRDCPQEWLARRVQGNSARAE